MKKIFYITITMFMLQSAWTQSISNQVIGSNGFSASSGGTALDFTVGELVVSTISSPTNKITQGFHQTYQTSSAINEEEANISINVYPNPTVDMVNILMTSNSMISFKATVIDAFGRVVQDQLTPGSSALQIDMSTLAAGTYYIHLSQTHTGIPIKTIQIQKLTNQ